MGQRFFIIVATSVCFPLCQLRIKVSCAKVNPSLHILEYSTLRHDQKLECHLAVGLPVPHSVNLGEGSCPKECDDIVILYNRCWSRFLVLYVLITYPPPPLGSMAVVSVNPAPLICLRWRLNDADGGMLLPSFIAFPLSNQSPLSPS